MTDFELVDEVKRLNGSLMKKVQREVKSFAAGELLVIADELNEESMLTINRLVAEACQKVEENLKSQIDKRFEELAASLANKAEKAIAQQCNKMATELRI